jgi:PAS domain S-box-containing protein
LAPPGSQAVKGENKRQPPSSGETSPLNSKISAMKDEAKKKEQLIKELAALRDRCTEEAIEHYYDIGTAVNALLRLSLEDYSLEELLKKALDIILSVPSLSIETKGSIFLVEDEPEVLIQKVQKGLAEPLLKECARVPFGKCLCGRAASIKRIEFADHIDERHEVGYEGMAPHGHYCVPILLSENTIGVINLYLKDGHSRIGREEEFLDSVANTLAGIIKRKRAEEALKEKDKFMESMVQSSAVATFVVNAEHKVIYWNRACEDLTGIKSEDLLGTSDHWKAFYDHPRPCVADVIIDNKFDEMTNLYKVYAKSVLIPDGIRAEGWYPNLGGKKRYVVFDAAPIRDDNGKIIAAIETLQDITKRRQAEDALQEGQRQLKAILDNIPDIAWLKDKESRFIAVNEPFGKSCGIKPEDLVGKTDLDIWSRDLAERYRADDKEVMESGKRKQVEEPLTDSEGKALWIETTKTPIYDEQGNFVGTAGIARDITERKRTEEELKRRENLLQKIFDVLPIGLWFADKEGRLLRGNPAGVKIWGAEPKVSPSEYGVFKARRLPSGEEIAPEDWALVHTVREGVTVVDEMLEIDAFDGKKKVILNYTAPVLDDQGALQGAIVVNLDITSRKEAEEKLQRTLDSLRKAFGTTVQVMVSAIETRDPYTAGHQIRSADIARAIATEMGLSQEKIDGIRMAGVIHDIGKLSVPAEILSKPTKLTDIEFSLIKEHSRRGYEILKDVESPWPLAQIVYQHHERMDGSGYPRNLKGDEILMEARILAVADVVESMASHRPYRPALGLNAALEEIENNKGILYDDAVADTCLRLFREKGFQLEVT